MSEKRQLGQIGEHIACQWLLAHQVGIVQQNYHSRYGEIDIIANHDNCLVFVEVRLRRYGQYGNALTSITTAKQRKIIATAEDYLYKNPQVSHHDVRFDIIAIDYKDTIALQHYLQNGLDDNNNTKLVIQWIQQAFML